MLNKNIYMMAPLSPERSVLTKPPHNTLVLWISIRGKRTLQPPPLPKNTGYNTHLTHTHNEQWQGVYKEEESKFIRKTNWISMPLIHLVLNLQGKQLMWSFVEKALRSPIEVMLFHRVPPGGTRPVWPEVKRLEMLLARKTMPYHWWTDWLVSWWAG